MLLPDTITLRKILNNEPHKVGCYKIVGSSNHVKLSSPLINFTNKVVDPKLILEFDINNDYAVNFNNSISPNTPSPGVHIVRSKSDTFISSGAFFPILYDQGLHVNMLSLDMDTNNGFITVTGVSGERTVLPCTIVTQTDEVILDSVTKDLIVNYIPPRFLHASPLEKIDDISTLDINRCFYGEKEGRQAVYIPVTMGTSVNYPDKGNRLEGYFAIPELLTDANNVSLTLAENDIVYMATIDSSDFQANVFSDQDAFDLASKLPTANGSNIRWFIAVFQYYNGFTIGSPICAKLYYVTNTEARCTNMYRVSNIDYFDYKDGQALDSYVDETFFIDKTLVDDRTYIPSIMSRAMDLTLSVNDMDGAPGYLPLDSAEIRIWEGKVTLYVPSIVAQLDLRDTTACDTYLITDTHAGDFVRNLTHLNVYYDPKDRTHNEHGMNDHRSLVLKHTNDGSTIELSCIVLKASNKTTYVKHLNTSVVLERRTGVVNLTSSGDYRAFNTIATRLYSLKHYLLQTEQRNIVLKDDMMIAGGIDTTNDITDIETRSPAGIDGFGYTKEIFISETYANTSDENFRWSKRVDAIDAGQVSLYFEVHIIKGNNTPIDRNAVYQLSIDISNNDILAPYMIDHPSGIIRIKCNVHDNTIAIRHGSTDAPVIPIGDFSNGSSFMHVKLVKSSSNKVIMSVEKDGTQVYTNDTDIDWLSYMYLDSDASHLGASVVTVQLSNFAFYQKGTAITENAFILLEELQSGDTPKGDRVSWYRANYSGNTPGAQLATSITLLVPRFFLEENPNSKGLYTVTIDGDANTTAILALVYSASSFIYLRSRAAGSIDNTVYVHARGQCTPILERVPGTLAATPLKHISKIWNGTDVATKEIMTNAPIHYTGNVIKSYVDTSMIVAEEVPANIYGVTTKLHVRRITNAGGVAPNMSATDIYVYKDGSEYYLILSAGILMNNQFSTGVAVLKVGITDAAFETVTDIIVHPIAAKTNLSTITNAMVPPPTDANQILMIQNMQTLQYEFRKAVPSAGDFAWADSPLTNTLTHSYPALGKGTCSNMIHAPLVNLDATYDYSRLLNLISYKDTASVPSTIPASACVVTRASNGNITLYLGKGWLDKVDGNDSVIKLEIPDDHTQVTSRILQAIGVSKYILIDSTVSNGTSVNMDMSKPHTEILLLAMNSFTTDPDLTPGFTLHYIYKDIDTNTLVTDSVDISATTVNGKTTNVPPNEAAVAHGTYLPITNFPTGVLPYAIGGSVLDTHYAYIDEFVDNEEHRIVLNIPARALFYNGPSNNFLEITFTLMDDDHTAHAANNAGVCVTTSKASLIYLAGVHGTVFRVGNIILDIPMSGITRVYYYNGIEWNDMLDVTTKIVYGNTDANQGQFPIVDCSSVTTVDDYYHTPMILRNKHGLSGNTIPGNSVYTSLGDSKTFCVIPATWVSFDKEDTSTILLEASEVASIALHNAPVIIVYSGTRYGTISQIPEAGDNTQTVILSRYNETFILHVLKNGISVHQELLTASPANFTVDTTPVIPKATPKYTGGMPSYTRRIGVVSTMIRNVADITSQYVNEVSLVSINADTYLYIPSYVMSGNHNDNGIYRINITDPKLRSVLELKPLVCLFHGPIAIAGLSKTSNTRVYIGTDNLSSATIIYNTIGEPYNILTDVSLQPVSSITQDFPSMVSFMDCSDDVGCTMALIPSVDKELIPIDCTNPIVGSSTQRYEVTSDTIYMNNLMAGNKSPVNLAIPAPAFIDNDNINGVAIVFERQPRGRTPTTQIGLPGSSSDFAVSFVAQKANLIRYTGNNLNASTLDSGITIHIPRYVGVAVVLSNTETGEVYNLVQVNSVSSLPTNTHDSKDIISGSHMIKISFIRSSLGAYVFVQEGDNLLAYSQEPISWFLPESIVFHYHSNSDYESSEFLRSVGYISQLTELGCLPKGKDADFDCCNLVANTSASKSITITSGAANLLMNLKPYSIYGYYHVTVSNPTTLTATVKIYTTIHSSPTDLDIDERTPFVIRPGETKEIPLILLRDGKSLFIESTTDGLIARAFSMEHYNPELY